MLVVHEHTMLKRLPPVSLGFFFEDVSCWWYVTCMYGILDQCKFSYFTVSMVWAVQRIYDTCIWISETYLMEKVDFCLYNLIQPLCIMTHHSQTKIVNVRLSFILLYDTWSQTCIVYDIILCKLQIAGSDTRSHSKWAVSLVIADVHLSFYLGLLYEFMSGNVFGQ